MYAQIEDVAIGVSKMQEKKIVRLKPPLEKKKPSPIITDPQGCYTGRPIEKYETPVQDADDL